MSSRPPTPTLVVDTSMNTIMAELLKLEDVAAELTNSAFDISIPSMSQFESELVVSFLRCATSTLRHVVSLMRSRSRSAPTTPAVTPA